jgi:hypothetical protein
VEECIINERKLKGKAKKEKNMKHERKRRNLMEN